MLVIQRKCGQEVVIGGSVRVRVLSVRRTCVRLGIIAPEEIVILRQECLAVTGPSPRNPPPAPLRRCPISKEE